MIGGLALLFFPGETAVRGGDDRAECSHRPAPQRIIRSKVDRKKVVLHSGWTHSPTLATVGSSQDQAIGAYDYRPGLVDHVQPIQGGIGRGVLLFPCEATVDGAQDCRVRPHGPAVSLVFGKADRIDEIALGPRVLPLPRAKLSLGMR